MEWIASRENPRIKEYRKLNTGKQARKKLGKFTLEGTKLCIEAVHSGVSVVYALVTESWVNAHPKPLQILLQHGVSCYGITEAVESKISDTGSPQGIFCVCRLLKPASLEQLKRMKKILCLYDLQDPGNLGTMFRNADALGFEAVVLSKLSCDLFSPKVLRSTMGSVFHIPYYIAEDMPVFEAEMAQSGLISAAAVVRGANLVADGCNLPTIHLLYIGNEGRGLPEAFAQQCRYRITLAMKGKAESLNAAMAAGLLMWELSKQDQ